MNSFKSFVQRVSSASRRLPVKIWILKKIRRHQSLLQPIESTNGSQRAQKLFQGKLIFIQNYNLHWKACTVAGAVPRPLPLPSRPHMWRALIFNTINLRGWGWGGAQWTESLTQHSVLSFIWRLCERCASSLQPQTGPPAQHNQKIAEIHKVIRATRL